MKIIKRIDEYVIKIDNFEIGIISLTSSKDLDIDFY